MDKYKEIFDKNGDSIEIGDTVDGLDYHYGPIKVQGKVLDLRGEGVPAVKIQQPDGSIHYWHPDFCYKKWQRVAVRKVRDFTISLTITKKHS